MNESTYDQWVQAVRTKLIPQLERSDVVVSLVPADGEGDVKYAVELGLSVLMDKPIIAIIRPGTPVANKLVLVADRILELQDSDFNDPEKIRQRVATAMMEMDLERTTRQSDDSETSGS
jgi:nucleoside 2-deoxyribosyltransferase